MKFYISIPKEGRYEDRYGQYLAIFEEFAKCTEQEVSVDGVPWSWIPLLNHLNCTVLGTIYQFSSCRRVELAMGGDPNTPLTRTEVEVLTNFRPETADALWKCDMQWKPCRARTYEPEKEFIVTSNGSFHRPEVISFINDKLSHYIPQHSKVLLVPCAADKPYPAPLHEKCLEILPGDYYICVASGVIGLAPQDLWADMPWYDSGIPNQWRLFDITKKYFQRFFHERIVVYHDFYSETIDAALRSLTDQEPDVHFVNPVKRYDDYLDLMDPARLESLKGALK